MKGQLSRGHFRHDRVIGSQRGIALVLVLWMLVLLGVIAASFTSSRRTELQIAHNVIGIAKSEALADAGVYRAIVAMLNPHTDRRWRADGTLYPMAFGDGTVVISIHDEGGKIDLNKGKDDHLKRLFRFAGLSEDNAVALVDSIVDFRDEDDFVRLHGAEDPDYRAAGLSHGAKDRPFEAVAELNRVIGMSPAVYKRVAPFLTVYSGRAKIDLVTAPSEVLLAVPGIFPEDANALLAARARMEGPMPSEPLPVPQTAERGAFAMANQHVYTIRAEAMVKGGAIFVRETVVEMTTNADQPFHLLAWRRGTVSRTSQSTEAE